MARSLKRRDKNSPRSVTRRILKRVNRAPIRESERVEFLHSGSTTINLALSGRGRSGGIGRARIANFIGDGSSGKTLLALELAFRCWKNIRSIRSKIFPKVKKITIVYNNAEGVMDFPLEQMYGKEFVDDIEWVCIKEIEQFGRDYIRRLKTLKKGHFMLYIIDSWDAIKSIKDVARIEKSIKDDKEEEGSYNLEKQKYASSFFSTISGLMDNNEVDATLVIISQLRMKIGATTFGRKMYRTGGKVLDFYTHQVGYLKLIDKMKAKRGGRSWTYGIKSEINVDRSKVSKPYRKSEFTILYDYGFDDISSMADFLWGKKKVEWKGKTWDKRSDFVRYVEDNNLEDELADYTEETWQHYERSFTKEVQKRKKRY